MFRLLNLPGENANVPFWIGQALLMQFCIGPLPFADDGSRHSEKSRSLLFDAIQLSLMVAAISKATLGRVVIFSLASNAAVLFTLKFGQLVWLEGLPAHSQNAFWLASGVNLAGLLLLGLRWWPVILLAPLLVVAWRGGWMQPARRWELAIFLAAALVAERQRARDEIQTERERALEISLSEERAHLEALRYQLSPHFLFNSLNSIYSTLPVADAEVSRQMLTDLSG